MLTLTLLAVGMMGQVGKVPTPTMRFTNNTSGVIRVWIYAIPGYRLAGGRLDVPPNKSGSIVLREGNFEVVAKNGFGIEARSKRTLAPTELDWMDFNGIYGAPTNRAMRIPRFGIGEHPKDDEEAAGTNR